MKLKNVKVGMRVFVKDREDSKALEHYRGVIGKISDNDWSEGGTLSSLFEIRVRFPCGSTDLMDARDVRKLREGEV